MQQNKQLFNKKFKNFPETTASNPCTEEGLPRPHSDPLL